MKVLRIIFAITACALPLLLCSCSKMDISDQQAGASQQEEVLADDSAGSSVSSVQDLGDRESTAEELSEERPQPDTVTTGATEPEPTSPARPKVEDRKSNAAALAKGEINFDDLKFDLEKDAAFEDEMLTKEIRELDGRKVKLRGYILPSTLFSETNISQFVLVRDNQECCFGPGAALFDCVMVQMVPGKTTDFVTRPVTVEGTFVIDTDSYRYPPGLSPTGATHMAVFRIEGESVQ